MISIGRFNMKNFNIDISLIDRNIDLFLENLIDIALSQNASDIHIEGLKRQARIRLRIDGSLVELVRFDESQFLKLVSKVKLLSNLEIYERRKPKDGRLYLERFKDIDFRISTINTVNGEKLVIRILSFKQFSNASDLLGFSQRSKEILEKIVREKTGMVIFSGPTGSGKSTSLYSLLEKINKEETNIVTVEDPVEYSIDGINQIEVNEKIDLDFAKSLRSILRQDPDIIMVGEIRDEDTAKMAVRSAITGHLLLSTLHTRDAFSSIIRLKDLGVENYLLGASLRALASQRLVRRLCSCKIEDKMTDFEYQLASKYKKVDRNQVIYRKNSCEKCHGGYLGREAIEEVFLVDEKTRAMILEDRLDYKKIMDHQRQIGFVDIFQNGLEKVFNGITTFDEILRAIG